MKTSKAKLDADFIGGGRPLTKMEEKRISDFLKNKKKSKSDIKTTAKKLKRKKASI